MSGGDEIDSCTRVPAGRCMWSLWPCPIMPDNKYCRFSRPQHLVKIYPILEAFGWSNWMLGPILSRRGRQAEQTGGEKLPAHIYRMERKGTVWISPEF
jgi:hypothetical protein